MLMADDLIPPAAPGEKLSLQEMIDRSASFRKKFYDDLCRASDGSQVLVRVDAQCPACRRRDKACPAKTVLDEARKRLEAGTVSMVLKVQCDGYDEED